MTKTALPELPKAHGEIAITDIITPTDRIRSVDAEVEQHILDLMDSIKSTTLIHPIVLEEDQRTLRTGWCRLQALTRLGYTHIPYNTLPFLPPSDRLILEFEENERRLSMNWQDRILAIDKIHSQLQIDASRRNERWTRQATGKELNVASGYVSDILYIAAELKKGNAYILTADSISEAIRRCYTQKEQELVEEKSKRMAESENTADRAIAPTKRERTSGPITVASPTTPTSKPPSDLQTINISLSQRLYLGDCLHFMNHTLKADSIDLILTDIPYGIDMKNLEGSIDDIDKVKDEHNIDVFLEQCPKWLKGMFRVLKPSSWCILFYDLDHHEKIQGWARDVGFKVQRHPIHWIKLHPCSNKVPSMTWTKAVEHIMVLRKGNATLRDTSMAVNHYAADGRPGQKKYMHPFTKPFEVVSAIIQKTVIKGQILYDPFAGDGSILCAGIQNGLVVYGSELSEYWYPRLQQQVRKTYEDMYKGHVVFA